MLAGSELTISFDALASCFLKDCKPNGNEIIYDINMIVRVSHGALTARAATSPTTNIVKSMNLC